MAWLHVVKFTALSSLDSGIPGLRMIQMLKTNWVGENGNIVSNSDLKYDFWSLFKVPSVDLKHHCNILGYMTWLFLLLLSLLLLLWFWWFWRGWPISGWTLFENLREKSHQQKMHYKSTGFSRLHIPHKHFSICGPSFSQPERLEASWRLLAPSGSSQSNVPSPSASIR